MGKGEYGLRRQIRHIINYSLIFRKLDYFYEGLDVIVVRSFIIDLGYSPWLCELDNDDGGKRVDEDSRGP